MMSAFLQLFPLALVSLSLSSPSSLSLVTRSVSARSLARSLLSTVTGDDKMMESMSNAVAILLVTGGAFREPSSGHCSARHFHVTRQLPRDSTLPCSLVLFIPTLPLNPYITQSKQYYDSFYSLFFPILSFFFSFFFSLPGHSPLHGQCARHLSNSSLPPCPLSDENSLPIYLRRRRRTATRLELLVSPSLWCYFRFFFFFVFLSMFACVFISYFSSVYRWNRSCPTSHL